MDRLDSTLNTFAPQSIADDTPLEAGARNLLVGCAGVESGQSVLILHEDPSLGWFDLDAPMAVAAMAQSLGADVQTLQVGGPDTPLPTDYLAARWRADVEIWFARIGDQDRFQSQVSKRTKVVSYARTAAALASTFGTRTHAEMTALKNRIDDRMAAAKSIRVTCPLGTDLRGQPRAEDAMDVTVRRFPMCVPCPVPADTFSGTVALQGYLTPTGSRSYQPASLRLTAPVFASVQHGRIVRFEGPQQVTDQVKRHYQHVASLFGIDPDAIHSWHAGIHDGCFHDKPVEEDPDLWSNTVFGSPKWLHFHTCGDYAPGEICWMVQNPTVSIDGQSLWSNGTLTL